MRLYAWLQLGHVVLGAAGMWALARARGRSPAAAALAALALAGGAFLVLELRHAMFVATTAWLPWLLWAIERLAARRTVDHALWVALTLALALLARRLVDAAVGPDRRRHLRGGGDRPRPDAARAPPAGACARRRGHAGHRAWRGADPAGAWPHARLSPRALGLTRELASSYAWPSWRYLATLFLPTLYGDTARGTYVGAPDQWELCGYGIGLVGGLLALASLGLRERRGERIALLGATLVACAIWRAATAASCSRS